MEHDTLDEYKKIYDAMIGMHDLVHDLVDEIEKPYFGDTQKDHLLVENRTKLSIPIINAYESALSVCTKSYIDLLKDNRRPSTLETREVEKAIRRVFTEIMKFTEALESMSLTEIKNA